MRSWCLNVSVFSNVTSRVYDLFSGTKEKRGKRYLFEEVVYCSLSRAAFINVLQQILRFEDPFIRFNQFFHLFGLTNFLGAIFYLGAIVPSISHRSFDQQKITTTQISYNWRIYSYLKIKIYIASLNARKSSLSIFHKQLLRTMHGDTLYTVVLLSEMSVQVFSAERTGIV